MQFRLPLAALALTLSACSTVGPPRDQEALFSKLAGKWGPVVNGKLDCFDSQTISFSRDRTVAYFYSPHGFVVAGKEVDTLSYRILSVRDDAITMYLEGETRRTVGGDPIVWTLILVEDDAFVWRQTDWPADHTTVPRMRCDG